MSAISSSAPINSYILHVAWRELTTKGEWPGCISLLLLEQILLVFFFLHSSLWWWNPFWFLSSSYFSFFFNYLFYLVKFRLLLQSFLNFTHAWSADSEIDTFTDLVKQGAEEETIANIVESLLCFIKLLSNEISASKLGIKKHWKKKEAHFTFFLGLVP